MACKRFLALASVLSILAFGGTALLAEETPAPQEPSSEAQPVEPPKAEEPAKPGFWGDRFALYVAVSGGGAWSERPIDSSISTSGIVVSVNELKLDEVAHGRFSVGWQLPANRGHLLLNVNGYRENGYAFAADGRQSRVATLIEEDGSIVSFSYPDLLRWWRVTASDGRLRSTYSIPILDGDTVFYDPENSLAYAAREGPTANDLQNEMQTWDLLYQREFGGRRWSARWSAGGRYFLYKGNVPAGAWLNGGDLPGFGYTDGIALHLLPMKQDTSGFGPTASLEAQLHLFRDRVVLYGSGRIALLYENLAVDSGPFFTLVAAGGEFYAAPARAIEERAKTVWQVTAEVGARFRIARGLGAEIGYGQTSFQDSVLVPTEFLIPALIVEAPYGTSMLYNTRDILFGVLHAGVSFQF